MDKRRILIVFPDMHLGGATTALVAFLKTINFQKNDVDICFLQSSAYRINEIPEQVHILPDAVRTNLLSPNVRFRKICNYFFTGKMFTALLATFQHRKLPFHKYFMTATNQMLARIHCEMSEKINKEYDLAIAYLELWATAYVADKVEAKEKVAWVHIDYEAARLNPKLDLRFYKSFDKIMCVSQEYCARFQKSFPQLAGRIDWAENEIDETAIREKAKKDEGMEKCFSAYSGFQIVTVARLDCYIKGIDRIIRVVKRLCCEGFEFRWYLIGDGPDRKTLEKNIRKYDLGKYLVMLGSKENPYPYMARADLFVLASRSEAKPISVTEAQILGIPVIVTDYPAAQEQMEGNGGCVVKNDEGALYCKLKAVLSGEDRLPRTSYKTAEGKHYRI